MIGQEPREVERKVIAILRVLSDSQEPLGGSVIAHRLGEFGIGLGERAVRYHLKLMDERGLTRSVGRRDGRLITQLGLEELENALVSDRVGSIAARIELLAYWTSLDPERRSGEVPINTSLFPQEEFAHALEAMKEAFRTGLCVSDLVAVALEGERLGKVTVSQGKVGLATPSSIAIIGALFKAGIPLDCKFGGILQLRDSKPFRFVELIEYAACSLDPCQLFIAGRMTSVGEVIRKGEGKILANFCELPAPCRPAAEAVVERLKVAGLGGLVIMGEMSEPICEIPVGVNKVGMILQSGLNPVAAAVEAGIETVNHAMSGVIDFGQLGSFWHL
jgi:repressor of nif and glnA expression